MENCIFLDLLIPIFSLFFSDYFTSLEPREILLYRDVKDQSIRCKSRDIFVLFFLSIYLYFN